MGLKTCWTFVRDSPQSESVSVPRKLRIPFAALALLLTAAVAAGQRATFFHRGNHLYELCNPSSSEFSQGMCRGYVIGVSDGLEYGRLIFTGFSGQKRFICMSTEGTNAVQITDIVVKHLQENPASRHLVAASIVFFALHYAFPCAGED